VKKDHAIVAGVMVRANADASDSGQRLLVRNIVIALARKFAEDNPRFNHTAFYEACRVTDGLGSVILASDELIR